MAGLPPITVRSPEPYDLVGDEVPVCGLGAAFEGVFGTAILRDGNGTLLAQVSLTGGGNGFSLFHAVLNVGGASATAEGTLAVTADNPSGDPSRDFTVVVPITFGRALIDPYSGFLEYTVLSGDTLSGIAQHFYADGNLWPRLFTANRDRIGNPNLIWPGQVFRIPE
ncbi:MAG TPA: Gmad2 immunoglobulin-like domain-containing protein [Chloroflexota bacterium]|nr:Gmad2 immunoglobulin-like domain-containing protein [Chloroflexota bacterium]